MRTSMKTRNVANSIICLGLLTPWTNRSCQQSKILVNLFAYLLVDEVTKFLFANPIVTFAESLRYFVCVLSLSDVPLGYYRASSNCRPAFCFFQIPWLTSSCSFSRGVANGVPQKIFMEGVLSVAYVGHLYLVCAVCDVPIWRHIQVFKRSLLT